MEQLDLFADAGDPIPDRPGHTYRILKNGSFVVTAQVDGVGRVSATHRFLWDAVCAVEAQITAALAARPSDMFSQAVVDAHREISESDDVAGALAALAKFEKTMG